MEPDCVVDVSDTKWSELRKLWQAAFPICMVQVGLMAMGAVDTAIVGRVSKEALGSIALGSWYKLFWVTLGQGCLMSLDGLVSKAVGACDADGVGSSLLKGLLLAFIYSVPLTPLLLLCAPALRLLGQPAILIPLASRYCAVQTLAILPTLLFVVLRQTCQSLGEVRPLLLCVVVANVCNVFLDVALVWGMPMFGIPAIGPMGSAWATLCCTWVLLAMLLATGRRTITPYLMRPKVRHSLRVRPLARLALLGVPVGLHQMTEFAAFALMIVLIGQLGVVAVAAHNIAMSVSGITWNVSLGISSAAAVRTGRAVGRRDPAAVRRASGVSIVSGGVLMGAVGLIMALFPARIAALWTSDPSVLAQVTLLLPVAGAFQVFDSTQTIAAGVLRGLLDTNGLLPASLVGYWVIGTPFSILLSRTFGLGAAGVWWGMVAGLGAASALLQMRVLRRMRCAEQICRPS